MFNSISRRHALLGALALSVSALAAAQVPAGWPAKPIRILVAYPPGGVSDNIARALADKLGAQLGTPVIVENRAGAGGAIGMDAVAKASPDGYTLGFSSVSPLALSPHLGKLPFDPVRDIAPVAAVMVSPVVLLATSSFTGKDFASLIASSKAKPGSVRWSTSGLGTVGHILLEQVQQTGKIEITHIPYKGGGQQLTDALSGQFEVLSTNLGGGLMQHIAAGKLRPLAIGAPASVEALPQVPTFAELGYPAANLSSLFGVFAPGKTPDALVQKINAEINRALQTPDLRQRLVAADNVPSSGSPAEFARQIAQESQSNARIIQAAHIKAE